jgi:hypothetical protein
LLYPTCGTRVTPYRTLLLQPKQQKVLPCSKGGVFFD